MAIAFGTGCVAAMALPLSVAVCLLATAVFAALALLGGRKRLPLLLVAALCLGGAMMEQAYQRPAVQPVSKVTVSGHIARLPLHGENDYRSVLTLDRVRIAGEAVSYGVRMYVYDNGGVPDFAYGQQVAFEKVDIWLPSGIRNPYDFSFADYLWKDGVAACGTVSLKNITYQAEETSLPGMLYGVRAALAARIDELFPRQAALVKALLLGDKSELDADTVSAFREAGISHLLALSGLHITCVAFLIDLLVLLVLGNRRAAFGTVTVLLALYAVMVGFSASILRALIMYGLMRGGRVCGRYSDALTRLAAAFLLLLGIKPMYLYDTGFVLSFSAVAALILLTDPIARLLHVPHPAAHEKRHIAALAHRVRCWLGNMLAASMAIQVGTLPVVAASFGAVPLLTVLANGFALPVTMAAVFLGAIATLLGMCLPPLGALAAVVPDVLLDALAGFAAWVARIPIHQVTMHAWPWYLCAVMAAAVLLVSGYVPVGRMIRRLAAALIPLAAVLAIILTLPQTTGLEIVFLDVGQGDAAVVRAEDRVYLIDCGKSGSFAADYVAKAYGRLDGVFLSHADSDHAGGFAEVADAVMVENVYLPAKWTDMEVSGDLAEALDDAAATGSRITFLARGDSLRLSAHTALEVCWPEKDGEQTDDNANSLVLCLNYAGRRVLFTGDIPAECDALAAQACDVLKVAHHGAETSTSEAFLAIAQPEIAVISVGASNRYGHPAASVLADLAEAGADTYRTSECGAVTVRITQTGEIDVESFLQPEVAS